MRRLVPIAVAAAALVASAVAGSASPAAGGGWQRTDLKPVSQPVAAGGHLLLLAAKDGGLQLVALDPRTGKTVWTRPASVSWTTQGVAPTLVGRDPVVVYLKKVGTRAALAAIDARSGQELWRSTTVDISSWPSRCADDAGAVCLTSGGAVVRVRLLTADPIKVFELAPDGSGRQIGPTLYENGGRIPELLVATRGATIAWRKPLAQIIDLPGVSSDNGWNFDRIDAKGLFVGSAGAKALSSTKTRDVYDLSRTMTAGFRIRDGKVVWRSKGAEYVCGILPCPGTVRQQGSSIGVPGTPTVGLRTRTTGTVTASASSVHPQTSKDARVVLEGFNLGTGRTIWTFDAGRNESLIGYDLFPPMTGESSILLRGADGALVELDLATGKQHPAGDDADGWCTRTLQYKQRIEGKLEDYAGQDGLFHCDANGRRIATGATVPAFVGELGAHAGGLVAWSDANRVYAAPTSR